MNSFRKTFRFFHRSIFLYAFIFFIFNLLVDWKAAQEKRTHFLLGIFSNGGFRNDRDGVLYFERKIAEDAPQADSYAGLGACYFNLRRYDKAVLFYRKAVALDPGSPALRDQLSLIDRTAKKKGRVKEQLKQIP